MLHPQGRKMHTRVDFITRLGVTTLGSALFASGPFAAAAAPAGTRNLRFCHWTSTDSPHHTFAVRFAHLVAKRTSGALAITVYPSEELGTYNQQLDAQRAG